MVHVLDIVPLPWHDQRVQDLRTVLTEAYPSGSKAEDIVSKLRGFPLYGVNWAHQEGAQAIWKIVLGFAAQTVLLRKLLDQVLNDQSVSAHHARIRAIIEELEVDADWVDVVQPNTPTPELSPQLVTGERYDGDPDESSDRITAWERAVTGRCRKALEGIVPGVVARPDLAAESVDEALAALRAIDVILNTLSVAAVASRAKALSYARFSQAAEGLRANRDAASGTLQRLRHAQRPKAISSLCETLADRTAKGSRANCLYAPLGC